MRNSPGRCVSTNSGEPIFESPTRFASRAMVNSSFCTSGEAGRKRPVCIAQGRAGSAAMKIFRMGAVGGSPCNCRRSKFNKHF